jgi:hypothetical protein
MMKLPDNAADAVAREQDVEQLRQAARGMLGIQPDGNLEVLRESLVSHCYPFHHTQI